MGKGSDFSRMFGWETGSWFQLMGISKGEQGIAEGGKLVIIKRTWEMQNNVRATSCPGSGPLSGGTAQETSRPPLQCRPFKLRASPSPSLTLSGPRVLPCVRDPTSTFPLHQHLFLSCLCNLNSPILSLSKQVCGYVQVLIPVLLG